MKQRTKAFVGVAFVLFLFWFWPNFVHEPLHLAALEMQGHTGTINFDFSFPPRPSTTADSLPDSLSGLMLYVLLPSIVSVALLIGLFFIPYKSILLNISVPVYLATDLFLNVMRHSGQISDFRFLTLMPSWISTVIIATIACIGLVVILKGVRAEQMKVNNEAS